VPAGLQGGMPMVAPAPRPPRSFAGARVRRGSHFARRRPIPAMRGFGRCHFPVIIAPSLRSQARDGTPPMFSLQTIFGSGKQFYDLLDESADAAYDAAKALHAMMKEADRQPALDAFKLARVRERSASDKISQALVDSFMTPIEREDIESLGSALYKIPKQIEKFADRYSLALQHLEHIDFAPRAAMLEQAASVVVEMVHELKRMDLDHMSALNEKLRALENEADRLMLELYRDIYSGKLDHLQMFLLKEFFEILEKAIDRCREAGVVAYQVVLKNS
jgi:uncharacterized protein Yka (UPF0111/DUF47 family)